MRRARFADTTGVSLFPCLAVMLCLTGVMIVVLVMMTRLANSEPDPVMGGGLPAPRDVSSITDALAKLDDLQANLATALTQKRQELGYVEDQRRELERRGLELHAELEQQRRLASATDKE